MEMTIQTQSIRSLMPDKYLKELVKRTKRSVSYICKVVKTEDVSSPIWPEVLKLAGEEKRRRTALIEQTEKLKAIA
jgi:hypothetical protein